MGSSLLFQPFVLGQKLSLRNRLVMAPMTTTAGNDDGSFSEEEITYLARRGDDGLGLIMSPACFVAKSGHSFERQVGCHTDAMLERLGRCAHAINRSGAASFLQLHHGGNAARAIYAGRPPMAPSAIVNRRGTSELPRAMSLEDIEETIEAFALAAGRAREAGFTGVEIHGANTYLFQQFFSPFSNHRSDDFGPQSLDNRCRFAVAVVSAVRSQVGSAYPISYRISPEEPEPDGYSVYDALELLRRVIAAGVDIVHVSSWEYGVGLRGDYPADSHPTLEIKRALGPSVPVIGVGGIFTPAQAEQVLKEGIDLVALGRVLLLNDDWVTRVKDSREAGIRMRLQTEAERAALPVPRLMRDYTERFFTIEE